MQNSKVSFWRHISLFKFKSGVSPILLFWVVIAIFLISTFEPRLKDLNSSKKATSEALLLPHTSIVKFLSFGYERAFAQFFWFKTINYFGKHHRSDKNYEWLSHMCQLVTELDPSLSYVYEFGATMLSWEANQPNLALALLNKGTEALPRSWKLFYLRGFTHYYFLEDPQSAKEDFVKASQMPGVHPMVPRLAAKVLASEDDPKEAIEFLKQTLETQGDSTTRAVILERLKDLYLEYDLRTLEDALLKFQLEKRENPTSIEELAQFLARRVSLQDPFGGSYKLVEAGTKVTSTSNKKRLGRKNGSQK